MVKIKLKQDEIMWDYQPGRVDLSKLPVVQLDDLGSWLTTKNQTTGNLTSYKFGQQSYKLVITESGLARYDLSHISPTTLQAVFEDEF